MYLCFAFATAAAAGAAADAATATAAGALDATAGAEAEDEPSRGIEMLMALVVGSTLMVRCRMSVSIRLLGTLADEARAAAHAAWPERRPQTTQSRSELPPMRFLP